MWKDTEGKIVTKKPAIANDTQKPPPHVQPQQDALLRNLTDFGFFTAHEEEAPISPPDSHNPSLCSSLDDHDSSIASKHPPTTLESGVLSESQSFLSVGQRLWSDDLEQSDSDLFSATTLHDTPFDDIFNLDTASSFNNLFTTPSNYSWLFDMNLAQATQVQQQQDAHDPFPDFSFTNSTVSEPRHTLELEIDHMDFDRPVSCSGHCTSNVLPRTDSITQNSPKSPLTISPLREDLQSELKNSACLVPTNSSNTQQPIFNSSQTQPGSLLSELERPMSVLQPSRSLPVIHELARQQVLDLIDTMQPTAPDGTILMRDHHLLSLSCIQTYSDLFWVHFNTTYPLIHMPTFETSRINTLLLVAVLLLGATYAEKEAHQIAVRSKCSGNAKYSR